ncbi:hypothetical protein EXIGLDRAFT_729140 [Exidia glandulosa HHB12029]|uniref:Uncharacterized protein n=1 Tax=Exidia glandulosa HHB12029 TaxID=1314781 RepID=A0A165CQ74_EXIGL|nr:hypothetical protein EXIGLDRAFT_729140 [Exidia glandulosa HHB12029]
MYPVPVLNNEGGYSGGKGRSLFGDWKCPIHGELKVCPVGVCPEAGAEKARILRAQRKGNGGGGGGSGGMSPWTRNGSPAPRDDRDPLARAGTKGGVRVVDKGGQRRIGHGQSVPPGGKQNANAWTTVGRSSSRY